MSRLSKRSIVQTAKRIALAVLALPLAPVLIPVPVRAKAETQLTRRIR